MGREPRDALRAVTALAGIALALALTACARVPPDVQLDDGIPPVTVPEPAPTVWTNCTSLDGFPFQFWGPADNVPDGCTVIGTFNNTTPILQGAK